MPTDPSLILKDRFVRTLLLILICLLVCAITTSILLLQQKSNVQGNDIILNVAGIGGPWILENQNGKTVSNVDFHQVYKIIYFGFASCPAVCPTELQKIAQAYQALPKEQRSKVAPIFITVDPERDTPKILKSYVALFDPHLIGLTGSEKQIDAVKDVYKIYAVKVPDGDSYTMDHSSYIYFMSPDDKLVALFKPAQNAKTMADFIQNYLNKIP